MIEIIACQTVGEELSSLLPQGEGALKCLEFGLHKRPNDLRARLQEAINATGPNTRTILLGYGLCSNAVAGLEAGPHRLVIPKVDDCVALFLGSRKEYMDQFRRVPGTFYLSRGWIECGDDPYTEYRLMRERYGRDKAYRIAKLYIANYTRLAFIGTGIGNERVYVKYAEMVADCFGLGFEEIPGSDRLLAKMLRGDWDEEFVVVEPGGIVGYEHFYPSPPCPYVLEKQPGFSGSVLQIDGKAP